jgi:NTP pyrophosphatase (non-canonical NTP hydrolase)
MHELTPTQTEILLILAEECAEVIQAISKIKRFGLNTEYKGTTNFEMLAIELGDVLALIELTKQAELGLTDEMLNSAKIDKLERIKNWLNYLKKH